MDTHTTSTQYAFKTIITCILYTLISAFIALPAIANVNQYKLGELEIIYPWTRETPKSAKVGSGYLHIINHGNTPDRLIAISMDGVQETEIHSMAAVNNIMQMKKLSNGIEIPGNGEIILKPGGNHIMFIGLSQPFQQGNKINAKLTFEKAGAINVDFFVDAIGVTSSSKPHTSH
ncbi:copper chaperone PCu(A)C [Bartonella schoenbuchensis]|uniref:Copper chaperone PCu(A)C n=2 Tax=Bartonella schoenbuchensis TaxID=165694 RepID=E6YXJ6_BARSR|nr:copper chaperone PCu(A)C [Bartonella schoenbuchensis]AQX30015.1 hypothetical protein BscR1v2_000580 [Bartonella schoenbuchensis R1]CBI81584.1 conserved exported hypothetical protein [Bartonella schoenbuchensis R1]CDP79221.1 hypothetical membrane protein [Bartonella schoenbuchensis]